MKTSELTGVALDWAVAKCEGGNPTWLEDLEMFANCRDCGSWNYSTNWSQGGPIIERELIQVNVKRLIGTSESGAEIDIPDGWQAHKSGRYWQTSAVYYGPTPLIAAMRCYVASKLGDEVKVPEELIK